MISLIAHLKQILMHLIVMLFEWSFNYLCKHFGVEGLMLDIDPDDDCFKVCDKDGIFL